MRFAVLCALMFACEPADPLVDAWHAAIDLSSASESLEGCDAEPQTIDPYAPYVFVAVDRGTPDLVTLYWCSDPEECTSPLASAYLKTFELDRLDGDQHAGEAHGALCSITWTQVSAVKQGTNVDLTIRTGISDEAIQEGQDCEELAADRVGEECTGVLLLSGQQTEAP